MTSRARGEAIEDAFHAAHERLYTYALRDQEVVLVNAGVSVIGRLPAAPVARRDAAASPAPAKARRQVFLGGWTEVPVYDFAASGAGSGDDRTGDHRVGHHDGAVTKRGNRAV